jgi:hypothetical protein
MRRVYLEAPAGELSLALWLLVKGIDPERRTRRLPAA